MIGPYKIDMSEIEQILYTQTYEHYIVVYAIDEHDSVVVLLYTKTESGGWVESSRVSIDHILWQYFYDNNIVEAENIDQ